MCARATFDINEVIEMHGHIDENFHIMFIDESRIEENGYTCVVGLIVPAIKVIRICRKINQIIKRYLGRDYSFSDGTLNLKWIRRIKHEKTPFVRLTQKQRYNFTKRVFRTLKVSDCTLLCSIVEERENYQNAVKEGLYFILERFFYFLKENDSYGIVISDKPASGKYDYMNELIELVRSFEYWGEEFKERIYQDIFFTRDEWDPMVQVTDLLAFTFSSYIRRCLKHIPLSELSEIRDFRYRLRENRFFKVIIPLIRKKSDGQVLGYGIKC